MLFSKVKRCKDERVTTAGLEVLMEYRSLGTDVRSFAACFVGDRLVCSFGYGIPYPQNVQTAMAAAVAKKLPHEEKYRKADYYRQDIFEEKCAKRCKGLWLTIEETEEGLRPLKDRNDFLLPPEARKVADSYIAAERDLRADPRYDKSDAGRHRKMTEEAIHRKGFPKVIEDRMMAYIDVKLQEEDVKEGAFSPSLER